MARQTIPVELPEELIERLGTPEQVSERARSALILDMLREAQIGQGKAAELLGVTRYDILDLMARHGIESGPETPDEIETEFAGLRDYARPAPADAGR